MDSGFDVGIVPVISSAWHTDIERQRRVQNEDEKAGGGGERLFK